MQRVTDIETKNVCFYAKRVKISLRNKYATSLSDFIGFRNLYNKKYRLTFNNFRLFVTFDFVF